MPFNGCDEWEGILLCLVFVPRERHQYPSEIHVYSLEVDGWLKILLPPKYSFGERNCKFESHHLWLVYLPHRPSPKSTCGAIDAKGFHEVEIKIATVSVEVGKIGFGLVYKGKCLQYLLL